VNLKPYVTTPDNAERIADWFEEKFDQTVIVNTGRKQRKRDYNSEVIVRSL
jgi:hypothetical protein